MRSALSSTGLWAVSLAVAVGFLTAEQASAQETGTIRGSVVSAETSAPLAGASVFIIGTARGALTSADGTYRIQAPPGVYTVRARSIGYESVERRVTVTAGETVTVEFGLPVGALVVSEIVAVGSRTTRSVLETPVPVDVISAAEIRESGETEVNQILRTVAPSFNASHQTIADGTDHINPASLRGLGPDQVLVLINGKRRHPSALVHVNGTFGRGTVGVDLNGIPTAAIERIEILRDGAAAQYGSDAIAGVINIVLKEQTRAIEANFTSGATGEGDGELMKGDVNFGFPIGERGFFNVTGEFLERGRTDRSATYTGAIYTSDGASDDSIMAARGLTRDDFTMKTGQSDATFGGAFFNSLYPLTENSEFYAFGGVSKRDGEATGFYRLPRQEERVVFEINPNGFLPIIATEVDDGAVSAGVRGSRGGWDLDLSVTRGSNSFQFNIENSNNASMGASSPTSFDAGRLELRQTAGNFDAVRLIDTRGALKSLSLVLGSEFRVENYEIEAGDVASWQLGTGGDSAGVDFDTTSTGAPKNPGSQVFPGFQPANEVNRFRNSISLYAGLESQITDQVLIDVGGRFENYSDFGSRVTGKAAARFEVAENFALRGAVSSGFRAPSLQQIWFNNVSIQFVLVGGELEPARVLTGANLDPVTKAFGIPPLEEETSVNISAGFTARPIPNLSITADFYRITIDDRIVLTSRFSSTDATIGPDVATILEPFEKQGVGQAQFFANAVDTETRGVDVVAEYRRQVGEGQLTLTGSANFTETEVERINVPQSVADEFSAGNIEAVRSTLFNREERNRLEDALPRSKGAVSARYEVRGFSVLGRANYYGNVRYKPTNAANDETFTAKVLFDLDLGYQITRGVRLSAGAVNIFDTFPSKHAEELPNGDSNRSSGRFPFSRRVTQFGMNGGFYYGRVQFNL